MDVRRSWLPTRASLAEARALGTGGIVVRFAAITAVVLVAAGLGTYFLVRNEIVKLAERDLAIRSAVVTEVLANQLSQLIDFGDVVSGTLQERFDGMFETVTADLIVGDEASQAVNEVFVIGQSRRVVYANVGGLVGQERVDPLLEQALAGRVAWETRSTDANGRPAGTKLFVVAVPIRLADDAPTPFALETIFDYSVITEAASSALPAIAGILAGALAALFLLLTPLLRVIVRTLSRQNAELVAEAASRERRTREQEALAEVGRLALAEHDLAAMRRRAVELAASTIGADRAAFMELEAGGEAVRIAENIGWDGLHVGDVLPLGPTSASGQAVALGRPIVIEDVAAERDIETSALRRYDIASALVVPIGTAPSFVGTIGVYDARPRDYVDEDVRFLESLAAVLAAALRRVVAERQLADAEERYRNLVERLPIVTYIDDPGLGSPTQYVSPQIEALVGYGPEEWLADPNLFEKLVHPDDRDLVLADIARNNTGEATTLEYRLVGRDGRTVWVYDESVPELGPAGEVLCIRGFIVDVTEQTEARRQLAEAEERFRSLVESMPIVMYIDELDEQRSTRTVYANQRIAEVTGYGPAEWIGTPGMFERVLHPDDRAWVVEAHERWYADPTEPLVLEYRVLHRDGRTLWVHDEVTAEVLEGLTTRVRGFWLDVTARREAEAALRASEERFRALIEHSTEVITVLDVNGTILLESNAMELTFGHARGSLLDTPAFELIHPDDVERVAEVFAEAILDPERVQQVECRLRHGDGSYRDVEIVGRNMLEHPAVRGVVINARDVTERREAERALEERDEQLRQSQKMEAVGRLAGGVAHDFNNLLTVISGNVDLVLEDIDEDDPIREDLDEVQAAAARAAELTRQLLAFSRKSMLQPRLLDLNLVVAELDRMLRRLIGEDVRLSTILGDELGTIRVDPSQIEQIVLNLAVNARDAMPQGGHLTIETRNVELDDAYASGHLGVTPGQYVLLAVSDTGLGMDAETLRHIFEPFFTTKAPGAGTGLGLATVHGIVEQSGGHVWVYSEPGRGTSFKLYFPRTDEPARERAPAEPGHGAQVGETVLVVEDEAPVRRLIVRLLAQEGYAVIEAANGQEALALLERDGVDLLLTDVVMPGGGGSALAESLRSSHPAVRVLFMSGYTDDAVVRHGILDPSMPFIEKPFTPNALLRRVRETLDA
ncbi:MAG: PAS domain S-box protein [Thermoleophilia bacterium]